MLDMVRLRRQSGEAFVAQMRDKVDWVSNQCWPANLELNLKEINELIVAGVKLGVCQAKIFSAEEITEMVSDLSSLRTLEMKAEAREYLISALAKKGVDPRIFPSPK